MNSFAKAWENLQHNWLTVTPAVLILAIILILFNGLLGVQQKTSDTLAELQNKFSITIFLRSGISDFDVTGLINKIEARADVVAPVTYTSQDEARTFIQNAFSLKADTLKEYNLSLPPSLTITPKQPQDAASIESYVRTAARELLHDLNSSQTTQESITAQMSEFIQGIEESTKQGIFFFLIIFIVAGSLLISSTIYLAISARHKEIVIMKLIGVHFGSVSAPYVAEGILIALSAYVLNIIGTAAFDLLSFSNRLAMNALLFELVAVLALGALASYATATYYLKK